MAREKIGVVAIGAYIPYYYVERDVIGKAWGTKGMKGKRSIANSDEDSLTMSVEAARECLKYVERKTVTHHYNATTTSPYTEKSGATLISTACDLPKDVLSIDFNSSLRSAASALKLAFDTAVANAGANVLVTAADTRNAAPKSNEEQLFGDAAVAVAVGEEPVLEMIGFASVDNEIHDFWRNDGEKTINTTEQRFAIDEGYMTSVPTAVKTAMKNAGVEAGDISKLCLNTPGMKEYLKAAKKCGISEDKIQDPLMTEVGNCGAAQSLLILACAMETAEAGDIIVMADYGTGANAFVFRVTEKIDAIHSNFVTKFFERRAPFNDYARFLSFRGQLVPKQGEPFKIPAAPSITWREQNTYLKLYASTCTKCGCKTFPTSRVCYNCRSIDTFYEESRTEARCKLFSFSIDRLAGRSDDPLVYQCTANDDENIRFYMNMTDVEESEVEIGMDLEFTFRKIHNLANLPNYYWKFRPIRCKEGDKQ